MHQAWVVAVDMGYGHQRAAYPFRDIACEGIITAKNAERGRPLIALTVRRSGKDPSGG
jgi:hypothetical protein